MGRSIIRAFRLSCCLLVAATPAIAGSPAALVTDVSGEVRPAVGLFDEIESGTELEVDRGASLTLEHYASCEVAEVTGGIVAVGAEGFDLSQATVADRAKAPCPATVTVRAGEMVGAGIVLRSVDRPTRVPLAPGIVIAGGGAGFDGLRVERDGQLVWTLPVRDGRVDWPQGRRFLTDQGSYLLVLTGPAGEHRAKVVADRATSGLTVLRP